MVTMEKAITERMGYLQRHMVRLLNLEKHVLV